MINIQAGIGTEMELTVGPVGHGGFCVARHQGRGVVVRAALPGERHPVRWIPCCLAAGARAGNWTWSVTTPVSCTWRSFVPDGPLTSFVAPEGSCGAPPGDAGSRPRTVSGR